MSAGEQVREVLGVHARKEKRATKEREGERSGW